MNTKISRITHHQSRLGGFAASPSPKPIGSSSDGEDDNGDDASFFETDDEMNASQ